MTREQKVAKRKARAQRRAEKHREKLITFLYMKGGNRNFPLGALRRGSWPDPNSPTGYTRICDYYGTCQSPCNGDC